VPALVEKYQANENSLPLLISLEAGGTGLNLTAAETQATDRAYRIGQDKPVFVHKLLCQDTVEERIHKLQHQKGQLAAGILADADISQKLSPEMVRALLD
jgi:non-specific serine/threonine protein kinase